MFAKNAVEKKLAPTSPKGTNIQDAAIDSAQRCTL